MCFGFGRIKDGAKGGGIRAKVFSWVNLIIVDSV